MNVRTARYPSLDLVPVIAAVGFVVASVGCSEEPTAEPEKTYAALKSDAPVLVRLTQDQYRNAVVELLGDKATVPAALEPDVAIHGLLSVGAGITPVSERGVELFEESALALAGELATKKEVREAVFNCAPATVTDADTSCVTKTIETLGRRAWRRPLTTTERDRLVKIATTAAATLKHFYKGFGYALAAILQSPHFIYRPEFGAAKNAAEPRRYTSWEMASRLSFFLWNGPPDDKLLDAAAKDELIDDATLKVQVERMIADGRMKRGVRAFFSQWLNLAELDELTKDPKVFKHYSAELGAMAREETLRVAEYLVLEQDADLREFFIGRTTFVNRRLAAIYNVKAPAKEGFGKLEFPESGQRRGFFGQVAFLALNSHPVSTSAVLRGVYLREHILCQKVPPPPSDLNTAIPEVDANAKTMRQRLVQHMANPACAGCHRFTDIPGLGFERFDGIGRYRTHEHGAVIDDGGTLDEQDFADFKSLVEVIANGDRVPMCFVEKMFAYASGRVVGKGEYGAVDAIVDRFNDNGRKVKALLVDLAMSEAFRSVGPIKKTGK